MGNDISTGSLRTTHRKTKRKSNTVTPEGSENESDQTPGSKGKSNRRSRGHSPTHMQAGCSPRTTDAADRSDTLPLEKDVASSDEGGGKEKAAGGTRPQHPSGEGAPTRPPPPMEPSAASFGDKRDKNSRFRSTGGVQNAHVISDAMPDVRNKYHINPREIGHGHYGVVRKCMDRKTREWFAIKSIRKSKVSKIEVLRREVGLLREVSHPNIIKLVDVFEDTKYIHLITELCTGGELFDRIIEKTQSDEGHFSERDAATIVRCILDAIAYCHDKKQIVHRDLKPENFLFKTEADDAEIKIIDFGLSRHDTQNFGIMKTKVGTPYYVAPEVLNREYTKSCDIWSIGVITYILLCGYPPFYGDNDNQIFDSVRTGRFDFPSPDWDCISDSAKDIICKMLIKNPQQRLTAAEALSHRWLREHTGPPPGEDEPPGGCPVARSKLSQVLYDPETAGSKIKHEGGHSITFRKFRGMQKLKKAALTHIATHLTHAEVGSLEETFRSIDIDGDGAITLRQLDAALTSSPFSAEVRMELQNLREDLQLSGEDTLNWKDFMTAMMDRSYAHKENKIRMAFEHFKRTDGECLLVPDLIDMFGGEGHLKDIIGDLDEDHDGRITYEEFRGMLMHTFDDDGN